MTVFFPDTNILVHAFLAGQPGDRARALLRGEFLISVQSLNEYVHVMRRKFRRDWPQIESDIAAILAATSEVRAITLAVQSDAMRLARRYQFSTYDAQIVASALDAQCDTLLSEDMHHGLLVDGRLTIRNPFA